MTTQTVYIRYYFWAVAGREVSAVNHHFWTITSSVWRVLNRVLNFWTLKFCCWIKVVQSSRCSCCNGPQRQTCKSLAGGGGSISDKLKVNGCTGSSAVSLMAAPAILPSLFFLVRTIKKLIISSQTIGQCHLALLSFAANVQLMGFTTKYV